MRQIVAIFLISTFLVASNGLPLSTDDPDRAEQLGGHFEGDIVMNEKLKKMLMTKTGLMDLDFRWENGIVPYVINTEHFNDEQLLHIRAAMDALESVTCIKIIPRTDEEDYVNIRGDNGGCYSEVGKIGGAQDLNLQPYPIEQGCFRKFSIVHEFLHALGFFHMQSVSDRDQYVQIVWDKIQTDKYHNFEWYGFHEITAFGVPYDYGSVMHYPRVSFPADGVSETIIPIKNKTAVIGQRVQLSDSDILRVNRMYNCGMEPEPTTTPQPDKPNLREKVLKAVSDLVSSILKGIFSKENEK